MGILFYLYGKNAYSCFHIPRTCVIENCVAANGVMLFRCGASATHFFVLKQKIAQSFIAKKGYGAATHNNPHKIKLMNLGEISMKRMKKYLSVLLALMMVVCAIPISTFTVGAEETATSGTCGENLTWAFDNATGTLTISGKGEMEDYDYNNRPWEEYKYEVTSVVINSGVTTVGDNAFSNCYQITNIHIPDSITAIGDYSFKECTQISNITIPNGVTSIGEGAFRFSSIETISIPDSVTVIGDGCFLDCKYLKSITIPGSVKEIPMQFCLDCSNLEELIICEGVEAIKWNGFEGCKKLTEVTIPSTITVIEGRSFAFTENLKQFGVDKKNKNFKVIDGCIYDISGNTLVAVPSGKEIITLPDTLTAIQKGACVGNSFIKSVDIPETVTSIGESAFMYCYSLNEIIIRNQETELCTWAFSNFNLFTGEDNSNRSIYSHKNSFAYEYAINNGFNYVPLCLITGHQYKYGCCVICGVANSDYDNEITFTLSIQTPSTTTIRYNDGIVLHANLEGDVPDGCTLVWSANNSNFSTSQSANGDSTQIISKDKGYTTFTLKLVDAEGYTLAEDSIEMYSKAGFFDKIGGFFRLLFGGTKIYEN